eukprot:12923274-Prorocentrum_lima.AAC.1
MATQSWAMMSRSWAVLNREGEAHLHLQQRIEAVAIELIRLTYVTATTLQSLHQMERFTRSLWTVL